MIKLIDLLKEITTREKFVQKELELSQLFKLQKDAFTSLGKKYGWDNNKLKEFYTKFPQISKINIEKMGYDEYNSFSYYAENYSTQFKEIFPELYNSYLKIENQYDTIIDDSDYKFGDKDIKYVYHYTTLSNAKQILKSNSIKGDAKKLGNSFISVTTDKDLLKNFSIDFSGGDGERSNYSLLACFVINFDKIKQDGFEMDYEPSGAEYGEQEIEILNKDIKPLNKYVVSLLLNERGIDLTNIKELAKSRNIKTFSSKRALSPYEK
jgi:phage anti-repressor protein